MIKQKKQKTKQRSKSGLACTSKKVKLKRSVLTEKKKQWEKIIKNKNV